VHDRDVIPFLGGGRVGDVVVALHLLQVEAMAFSMHLEGRSVLLELIRSELGELGQEEHPVNVVEQVV
jgi:hypothetical protein